MYYNVLNSMRSAIAIFQWSLLCKKKMDCFEKIRAILSKLASEGLVKRKSTITGLFSFSINKKTSTWVIKTTKIVSLQVLTWGWKKALHSLPIGNCRWPS